MTVHPRSVWVQPDYPVTGPPAELGRVAAVVYHYPGSPSAPPATFAGLVATVRAMQRNYLATRGYSLGYCYVIGPAGDVLEVRGLDIRNAANNGTPAKTGVSNYNPYTVSVQFLVADADEATPAQLAAAAALHLAIESGLGRELRVEGHGDKDATPCPGAGIHAQLPTLETLIRRTITPPLEDDVTDQDIQRIADAVYQKLGPQIGSLVWSAVLHGRQGYPDAPAQVYLIDGRADAARAAANTKPAS